jgi:hypothetical protein
MTTKVEKSRSELVREYLRNARSSKQKKPTAVVAALKEKGITVSVGLVSQVKNKIGKTRRRKTTKPLARKKDVSIEHLVHAKHLLQAFEGDIKSARAALETVKKLMS